MRFSTTILLLATTFTSSLAKPIPSDFNDIERRWSEGQSEAQIHAAHNIREASPGWPVLREAEQEAMANLFDSTTDERTMLARSRQRLRTQKRNTPAPSTGKMKKFVADWWRKHGVANMLQSRDEAEEPAPVLKPKRGIRYRFTA